MRLNDNQLSAYILDYMQHGSFGNTAQHTQITGLIKTNFTSFVKNSHMFLDSLSEATWIDIEDQAPNLFGEPAADYFDKYINSNKVSRDVLVAFVSKLFQKSQLFRERFYNYNWNISSGNGQPHR
jgi:hypothetical protein